MSVERAYSRNVGSEPHTFLADGLASWLAPHLSIIRRFPRTSSSSAAVLFVGGRSRGLNTKGQDSLSCFTNAPIRPTSRRRPSWSCTPTQYASGGIDGRKVTSPWPSSPVVGESPFFSPSRPGQGDFSLAEQSGRGRKPVFFPLATRPSSKPSLVRPSARPNCP
jgi:hypothetical protein